MYEEALESLLTKSASFASYIPASAKKAVNMLTNLPAVRKASAFATKYKTPLTIAGTTGVSGVGGYVGDKQYRAMKRMSEKLREYQPADENTTQTIQSNEGM